MPYNPAMTFDGNKLASIRKAAPMTQADLAGAVEDHAVNINFIEQGIALPDDKLAQRIADTLAVSIEDLHSAPHLAAAPTVPPDLTDDEARLLRAVRILSPSGRAMVLDYGEYLLAQHNKTTPNPSTTPRQ